MVYSRDCSSIVNNAMERNNSRSRNGLHNKKYQPTLPLDPWCWRLPEGGTCDKSCLSNKISNCWPGDSLGCSSWAQLLTVLGLVPKCRRKNTWKTISIGFGGSECQDDPNIPCISTYHVCIYILYYIILYIYYIYYTISYIYIVLYIKVYIHTYYILYI